MFALRLLSRIVAAPWQLLRALLRLDGAQETPSARAKARSKSKASSSTTGSKTAAATQPAPTKPKPKPKMSDAAKPTEGSKGELSYHYWHGKGGGNAPVPEPKKLTEEEKAELERQAASNGASAWNAAGTFEERNATSWAKGRLGELVKGLEGLAGGDVSVLDLNSCEGEANIFLVRGKKRCGFDFELQLAWKAVPSPGAIEIRGHCKVLGFCSDDPEDMEVVPEIGHKQADRAADEAAAMKQVKAALTPALGKVLAQLLDELKAK